MLFSLGFACLLATAVALAQDTGDHKGTNNGFRAKRGVAELRARFEAERRNQQQSSAHQRRQKPTPGNVKNLINRYREPVPEQIQEPVTELVPEPVSESVPEPVPEPVPEVSEPEANVQPPPSVDDAYEAPNKHHQHRNPVVAAADEDNEQLETKPVFKHALKPVPKPDIAVSKDHADWRRTTIIFVADHGMTQNPIFLRGGISHSARKGCQGKTAQTSPCSVPILHLKKSGSELQYDNWFDGDDYLDWYGKEKTQGKVEGASAFGTPLLWKTENDRFPIGLPKSFEHSSYLYVDFAMDCSKTHDGWFEVKAYQGPLGEPDLQRVRCSGSAGGMSPFAGHNHAGKCGHVNVFHYGNPLCSIENYERH